MPLSQEALASTDDKGGLILMTVTIRNALAPDYQPEALFARVQAQPASDSEKSSRPQLLRFSILPSDRVGPGGRNAGRTYLLRFQFEPGQYRFMGLNISAGKFPVRGFGFLPIHADFAVPVGGNYYLGNVLGVNRRGLDGEFRTGPPTPKVDQVVTGLADGTFDVSVRDRFDTDLANYLARFPELATRVIDRLILPPIDRQRAQLYWEEQ
ncbi:MAG: hypothetical protein AB8C46_24035 [Burkholderiaceae bacterium]